MQLTLNQFKQHQVLYVNILFTFFCAVFSLAFGMQLAWYTMWILVPILMPTDKLFCCLTYMSLYMRVLTSVKLFSIIVCFSFSIILIKELIFLNKNKLLNKYLKILLFYLILLIFPLFYSIFVNKIINISFIYYLNMINLLFLFYLLKNKLNKQIILTYCYGLIISSILAIVLDLVGLYTLAFQTDGIAKVIRFCAFLPLCNTLGVSCVICINSIYVLMLNKKIKPAQAIILIVALSFIGITTFSKNFFLMFSLTILIIFITQLKYSNNRKKFISVCAIAILALSPFIIYYGISMFLRFFGDKNYNNIIDQLTTGRLDKWLIYIKPWTKKLYSIIFGLGLGFNYNTVFSSHSLYVGYLSKIGIIGLVALLGFIYLIVFYKNKSNLKFKYLPIITILIICLAEDVSYNTFNFIPFVIAIITAKQLNTN